MLFWTVPYISIIFLTKSIFKNLLGCLFLDLFLTFSWRRSPSYRNLSIDLLCMSIDWFLYDRDLHHERDEFNFGKVCFQFSFRLNVTSAKKWTILWASPLAYSWHLTLVPDLNLISYLFYCSNWTFIMNLKAATFLKAFNWDHQKWQVRTSKNSRSCCISISLKLFRVLTLVFSEFLF